MKKGVYIRMEEEELNKIKNLAKKTGLSMSAIIRLIIKSFFAGKNLLANFQNSNQNSK